MGLITYMLSPGNTEINCVSSACLLARTTELMLGEVGGKLLLGWRRLELQHELWDDLADTIKVLKALPKILKQT